MGNIDFPTPKNKRNKCSALDADGMKRVWKSVYYLSMETKLNSEMFYFVCYRMLYIYSYMTWVWLFWDDHASHSRVNTHRVCWHRIGWSCRLVGLTKISKKTFPLSTGCPQFVMVYLSRFWQRSWLTMLKKWDFDNICISALNLYIN